MAEITTRADALSGTWTIDASHSSVEFSTRHLMITTVKGRFGTVEGSVRPAGPGEEAPSLEVRIDAASIDTRTEQRDEHLRSADFLDVASHPELVFRGRRVDGWFEMPGDEFRVIGDLTIRGTTREVVLDTTYEGSGSDPWGGERMSFSASTRIDRREFGLTWNQALETGGVVVGNDVKIALDVQFVLQA